MTGYVISDSDRRPLPASYRDEPKRLGWRGAELERPIARVYADAGTNSTGVHLVSRSRLTGSTQMTLTSYPVLW